MIYKELNEKIYSKAIIFISIFIFNNCNINKRKEIFNCCYYLCCKCCKKEEFNEDIKRKNKLKNLSIKNTKIISNSKSSNNSKTMNTNDTISTYNSTPTINYPENHNKRNGIIISSNEIFTQKKTTTPIPIENKKYKTPNIAIIHNFDYEPKTFYNSIENYF